MFASKQSIPSQKNHKCVKNFQPVQEIGGGFLAGKLLHTVENFNFLIFFILKVVCEIIKHLHYYDLGS